HVVDVAQLDFHRGTGNDVRGNRALDRDLERADGLVDPMPDSDVERRRYHAVDPHHLLRRLDRRVDRLLHHLLDDDADRIVDERHEATSSRSNTMLQCTTPFVSRRTFEGSAATWTSSNSA